MKGTLDGLEIPQERVDIVLDTDTYNEIDDQFALALAALSPDRLNLRAVYAAPFYNDRSASPGDGMEKSYDEILRVLNRLDISPAGLVFKGSDRYLGSADTPCCSTAALDLIDKAMNATAPLIVVAIGAITNIASAILIEPRIIDKITLVWLGGNARHWPHQHEFNLMQDIPASRLVFDCGVPLIQVPCMAVTSHMTASPLEVERHLCGKSAVGTYLAGIFREYCDKYGILTKEIWDVAAVAAVLNPEWAETETVHSPILNDNLTFSQDARRHFIKAVYHLDRDAIFRDMYRKLAGE